jgi:hypothetical protein
MTDRSGQGGSRQARVRWLGLLPLLVALSACAGDDPARQENLSLACEMRKCDCAPDGQPFKAGVPVLWQTDGSTYCPKAYHLRILDQPPSSKMVT